MSQAWEWTQRRPLVYCDTGGKQTIDEYLADAKLPEKKQLAVVYDDKLVSLITVRLVADGCFEIHVTSPPRTRKQIIIDALNGISESLFETMGAQLITTSCPTYGKHKHKGSCRLAEVCGMRQTGMAWHSGGADWLEYAITREQFYGKPKARTDERL